MENLKALVAILNLKNEQDEIDTHMKPMKSKHKIDCDSLSQLISKIKVKVNKTNQSLVNEIKDNHDQMYTQNSSNSNSANLLNNSSNACNKRFFSIYTKVDELKIVFKNMTDQYNELTTLYQKALRKSETDSDKLEASLNSSKQSLVQFQDQINNHKNGLLGDAAKSTFDQQKKKELIRQVEELIEAVKEHNTNIKEYNQNLDSGNLKLKKEITKIEKGYIFNKKSFTFVNKLLTKLREKQVEIKKNIRKENNKIVNQLKDIDKGCDIIIRKNDLTQEIVDAIVNPANEQLEHAGGAAYAILCAGGDIINEESRKYIRENGKLPTSCAIITSAGDLPCKAVIHVVGPKFNETAIDHTFEEILMEKTISSILEIVVEKDYKSVSIPAISTGIFKFPLTKFAVTCTKTIKKFVDDHIQEMKCRKIILCNFDDHTTNRLLEIVPQVLQNEEENENKKSKKDKRKKNVKSENDESEDSDHEVKRCKDCGKKIKDKSHQKKGRNSKVCINCFQNKSDDISKTKKLKDKTKSDDEEEEKIPKSRRNKRNKQDSDQSDSDDSENLKQNKKMKESKYKTMKKQQRNSDSEGSDEGMKESKKDKKKARDSDDLIEKKNKKKDKKSKKQRNDSDE